MNSSHHPENIFPEGPSDLNPEAVRAEISTDKYAIIFSAGTLALSATVGTFGIAPDFIAAVHESNAANIASDGTALAFLTVMAVLSAKNIRAYSNRWAQSKFNQRLNTIAAENDIEPSA